PTAALKCRRWTGPGTGDEAAACSGRANPLTSVEREIAVAAGIAKTSRSARLRGRAAPDTSMLARETAQPPAHTWEQIAGAALPHPAGNRRKLLPASSAPRALQPSRAPAEPAA